MYRQLQITLKQKTVKAQQLNIILVMSVGAKRRPRDSATVFCEAKKSRRV